MNKFTEDVRAIVEASTGKDVVVDEVAKVNELKTAISIRDGNIGANFYIDDFYEDGMSAEYCAYMIVEAYENCPKPGMDIENCDFSFGAIKDRLIVRLVSIERNKSLLKDVVYRDMGCGLAVIPAVEPFDGCMFNVSRTLAEAYGYNIDELIDIAFENDEKKNTASLVSMMGALFGGAENMFDMEDPSDSIGDGMLVLTNETSFMGASVMFHKGVLDRTHEIIGDDFYVLPSSIHEVIIVPKHTSPTVKDLKETVTGANKSVVEARDFLSDDVYYFNGELRKVA